MTVSNVMGHGSILGRRRGQINMLINNTVSPLAYVVTWQPDIPYMLYISQQQLNPIWDQGSRLPLTSKCSLLLHGMLALLFSRLPFQISIRGSQSLAAHTKINTILIS